MKFFLIAILFLFPFKNSENIHPIHVSIINIDYNEVKKEFEIMIRLFTDDFETIINHEQKLNLKLSDQNNEKNIPYINKFIKNHFNLKFNNKDISKYLKIISVQYDNQKNTTEIKYKIKHKKPKTVEVRNSLFLNHFNDQKNLFIFTCGKNQETCKFNRKRTEFEFHLK